MPLLKDPGIASASLEGIHAIFDVDHEHNDRDSVADLIMQSFRIAMTVDGTVMDITDRFSEKEVTCLAEQVVGMVLGR